MNIAQKILGWILLLYLGIMFIENSIYISVSLSHNFGYSLNIQDLISFYLWNIILIVILPIILFFTIRNIRKFKWHALIILIVLTIIIPKRHPFLRIVNDYGAGVLFENNRKVTFDEIVAQQNQSQTDSSQTDIKRENVYRFNYKNGEIKRKGILIESKEFEANGNVVLTNNTKIFYNSNNQKIKELLQYSKNKCDTFHYFYDNEGLFLGSKKIYQRYTTETTNKYDSNKDLIYWVKKMNDSIIDATKYIYNSEHKKVKSIILRDDLSEGSYIEYKYTDSTMTETYVKENGEIGSGMYFKYDSLGNWVEQSYTNEKGKKSTTYYYYDSESRKIKETSDSPSRDFDKSWKYDNNGLLISEIGDDGPGYLKKIDYFHDSNDRLIKKAVMDKNSGELLWLELTTYEYFDN